MIVTALGMHRSGTSVITRILNLLGVYLGPTDRLFKARADNQRGFWEHRDIVRINIDILASLGGSWLRLPSFPPGWEHAPRLEPLRERARAVIERDFAGVPMGGWKDPSTSIVLPFWQRILPSMHYIVCLRNPIDSARSLLKREGLSLEEGIDLWLKYVFSALRYTADQSRMLIFYEEVMERWSSVLHRIANFLEQPESADRLDVQRQMDDFIDRYLQHFRTSHVEALELGLSIDIVTAVQQAYGCLERLNGVNQQEVENVLLDGLKVVSPVAEMNRQKAHEKRIAMTSKAADEIASLEPLEARVILVDDNELGKDIGTQRGCISFFEDDGYYLGPPSDDTAAMRELERLREAGADYIVFAWPTFWWLEHFVRFHEYLRSSFPCVACNDCIVVFRLHPRGRSRGDHRWRWTNAY